MSDPTNQTPETRDLDQVYTLLEEVLEMASRADLDFPTRCRALLRAGVEVFGLELGLMSRVTGQSYEVQYAFSSAGHAIVEGTRLPLSDTYCSHALALDAPVAFHHASEQIREHPCVRRFGFQAYLGVPIHVDGHCYGTLHFSADAPRDSPFTSRERTLVRLLSQWVGGELSRREVHERLLDSKHHFELMFEQNPVALVMADTERRVTHVNPAFTRLFGFSTEQMRGRSTRSLYAHPEDFEETGRRHLDAALPLGRSEFEMEYRTRQGRVFTGQTVVNVIHDPQRRPIGYLGAVHDISLLREVERLKDVFVSTVSHELRSPLTSIRASLGMIQGGVAGPVPPRIQELLDVSERNCLQLGHIVDDILDTQRIASGHLELTLQTVTLAELLDVAAEANAALVESRQLELVVDRPDDADTCALHVDPQRVAQVLTNLIANATRFGPTGSAIDLVAKHLGDGWIRISVTDRGQGIPPHIGDQIFERFVQVEPQTRSQQRGTGLGLWISRQLVEALGGRLTYVSRPGVATTFCVDLPLAART